MIIGCIFASAAIAATGMVMHQKLEQKKLAKAQQERQTLLARVKGDFLPESQ